MHGSKSAALRKQSTFQGISHLLVGILMVILGPGDFRLQPKPFIGWITIELGQCLPPFHTPPAVTALGCIPSHARLECRVAYAEPFPDSPCMIIRKTGKAPYLVTMLTIHHHQSLLAHYLCLMLLSVEALGAEFPMYCSVPCSLATTL